MAVALSLLSGLPAASAGQPPPIDSGVLTSAPHGYPILLAPGASGSVWYAGVPEPPGGYVGEAEPEAATQLGMVTAASGFVSFAISPLVTLPVGFVEADQVPKYLTEGPDGEEWFTATSADSPGTSLSEMSAGGVVRVVAKSLPAVTTSGLTLGPDGNLWTTAEVGKIGSEHGAILRVTPRGEVTQFTRGLRAHATPANITAGPGDALWFTDTSGAVGRVTTSGAIREFPLRRRILPANGQAGSAGGRAPYEPAPPIVAGREGYIWFIVGPRTIGRMSRSGAVRFFNPGSSYHGAEARGARGALVGLAAAPGGGVWFTRYTGEVARIDARGDVHTITNRLIEAYGITFADNGVAWVGEGAGEFGLRVRIASIAPDGALSQYPPRVACPVPNVLGFNRGFAVSALRRWGSGGRRDIPGEACNERIALGSVRVRHTHRAGRLIVVSEKPRGLKLIGGYAWVNLVLARVPPIPRHCHPPRFYPVALKSSRAVIWKVQSGSPEETKTIYYGCLRPNGRVHAVAEESEVPADGGESVSWLRSAGKYVAYFWNESDRYGGEDGFAVLNMATGKDSFSIRTSWHGPGGANEENAGGLRDLEALGEPVGDGARDLALDGHGDVAWLGVTPEQPSGGREDVLYLHDQQGLHKLAVAASITGLAFHGSTLTWLAEGRPESAPA
jgi:streptogramin lyase